MTTELDGKKLDVLAAEIVDCLRGLLERQMQALDPQHEFNSRKSKDARKGLTSAYISFAQAQCDSEGWGNSERANRSKNEARQKLSDMKAKLEKP